MAWIKGIVAAIAALFVIFDSPYGVWAVHRAMGTSSGVQQMGGPAETPVVMGPDAPRPDWLILPPRALVITGSHFGATSSQFESGTLRYATTMFAPQTAKFHAEALAKQGFAAGVLSAREIGPATARAFGVLNRVEASNPATGWTAQVTVRKSESLLFGNRFVEIAWSRPISPVMPKASTPLTGTGFSTVPESF